ncbi:hypothetical protein EXIGLDRAFT_747600 [Exidia glandulosa HHB12029]|uniref:Stig1-domain-containing protein n=1 Tax=Exidia glandulosa HHB12029 TaxID=1314781 RepID=A0A165KN18_EXIGL|nr:hypothetical protein EXIGLDRAFT_747600 [Exidia glandulosa HHB12029]
MPRLLLLLLLFGALLVSVSAKPRVKRNGTATRTTSAVQARQATRERILGRADKLVMANLFGREDCSIPQPSTGACTCGLPYTLCGPSHPISVSNLLTSIRSTDNCGGCEQPCTGANPGCCGACGNACDEEELCCSGECIAQDDENCGVCGGECFPGDTCCGGQCSFTEFDDDHCGDCGTQCFFPYSCYFGGCENFERRRELVGEGSGSGLE